MIPFKGFLCHNEWVIMPNGDIQKCWDEYNKIKPMGNIRNFKALSSCVICKIEKCKSVLFTDKAELNKEK